MRVARLASASGEAAALLQGSLRRVSNEAAASRAVSWATKRCLPLGNGRALWLFACRRSFTRRALNLFFTLGPLPPHLPYAAGDVPERPTSSLAPGRRPRLPPLSKTCLVGAVRRRAKPSVREASAERGSTTQLHCSGAPIAGQPAVLTQYRPGAQ